MPGRLVVVSAKLNVRVMAIVQRENFGGDQAWIFKARNKVWWWVKTNHSVSLERHLPSFWDQKHCVVFDTSVLIKTNVFLALNALHNPLPIRYCPGIFRGFRIFEWQQRLIMLMSVMRSTSPTIVEWCEQKRLETFLRGNPKPFWTSVENKLKVKVSYFERTPVLGVHIVV